MGLLETRLSGAAIDIQANKAGFKRQGRLRNGRRRLLTGGRQEGERRAGRRQCDATYGEGGKKQAD